MEKKLIELINQSNNPEAAAITAAAVIEIWLHAYYEKERKKIK